MRLNDYIQGNRQGKEANRIERKALNDPFLQDALDGFDSIAGNHIGIIEELEQKYSCPAIAPKTGKRQFFYWSSAASVLLLIGFGAYSFLKNTENTTHVIAMNQSPQTEKIIHAAEISELLPEQKEEIQQKVKIAAKETEKVVAKTPSAASVLVMDEDLQILNTNSLALNEMVAMEPEAQKKSMRAESVSGVKAEKISQSDDSGQSTFGEKEFQAHCQQKADKNVCNGQGATVKLSFFIDESGKPFKIDYENFSCEEAVKEMEKLISSSPVWTNTKRKVTMTVKW